MASPQPTYEDILRLFQETDRKFQETDRQLKELAWIIHEPFNYWLSFPWQRESRLGNFYQSGFPPTRE